MFRTMTATVYRPTYGVDRLGNQAVQGWAEETVDGVLVHPTVASDLEAERPMGTTDTLTVHFPKGYSARLKGCEIALPDPYALPDDDRWRVVGDPMPYLDTNTPTPWHMSVEVEHGRG